MEGHYPKVLHSFNNYKWPISVIRFYNRKSTVNPAKPAEVDEVSIILDILRRHIDLKIVSVLLIRYL
jgi:hypothetical protein